MVSPTSTLHGSGLFASYHSFETDQQVLLWINNDGQVIHQLAVSLSNLAYAYSQNGQVHLIEESLQQVGPSIVLSYIKHSFSDDGSSAGTEILYTDALAEGNIVSATVYDLTDGELSIGAVTAAPSHNPVEYLVTLIKHSLQGTTIFPAWDPGPLPMNSFGYGWAIASAPWGNGILGFNLQNSDNNASEFWFQSYDSQGQPTRLLMTVPLQDGENVNSLDLLVSHETVYSLYTTFTGGGDIVGGAWVVGFPLENILSIDVNYSPIPVKIGLYAYPNPFNSVINFELSFTLSNLSHIGIYNTEGREVTSINLRQNQRRASWSPDDLSSGVYFAKLESGNEIFTQKLILLK